MRPCQQWGARGGSSPKRRVWLDGLIAARRALYAEAAAMGMTQREAARHCGVARVTITRAAKRYGLTFRRAR